MRLPVRARTQPLPALVPVHPLFFLAVAALALTTLVTASGCGPKAAAVVNGEKILLSQVDAEIASMRKDHPQVFEGDQGAKMEEQFRKRIVDNLVSNILVAQEAKAQGVSVTDADVDKKIASMEKQFHSKQQFADALAKSGTTLEALRERIRLQLITAKMVSKITANVKITDQDARDYYKLNREVFMTEPKARVRLIKLPAGAGKTADTLRDEIEGGASFATVAVRESVDDGTRAKGGDTGSVLLTELPTEVAPAVRNAKAGALLGPIPGSDAVYLALVVSKTASRQQSYAEVKDRIMSIIKQEREVKAFNDWIESLKKKADVKINI